MPVKLPHVYVSIWKFQSENKQAEVVQLPRAQCRMSLFPTVEM